MGEDANNVLISCLYSPADDYGGDNGGGDLMATGVAAMTRAQPIVDSFCGDWHTVFCSADLCEAARWSGVRQAK